MAGNENNTERMSKEAVVTYGRRKRRPPSSDAEEEEEEEEQEQEVVQCKPSALNVISSSTHNKYKQYFLDFGQLDFSCSTCKICGLLYARGHSDDEKLHALFHKRYLRGVLFKGWQKERLVVKYEKDDERVILVLHSDPLQHQLKVKELVKIMEKDLGIEPGWLLHDGCKVYLYISLKKVVGCAVTEPISQAYPVLWEKESIAATKTPMRSSDSQSNTNGPDSQPCRAIEDMYGCQLGNMSEMSKSCLSSGDKTSQPQQNDDFGDHGPKTLVFGGIKFQRERVRRCRGSVQIPAPPTTEWPTVCTKRSVAAICGIRGLWVSKSERRRGIATHLIDAVRTSFIYGLILDASQCAFSQPTPDGKAFAAKYSKTDRKGHVVAECTQCKVTPYQR